jgi:hypothetical protein
MRNPERTKKTSTPAKPLDIPGMPAWKTMTRRAATARTPSIAGRCVNVAHERRRVLGALALLIRWQVSQE